MIREQYIEMRISNQLDIVLCYEYYMENVKNPLVNDLTTFSQHLYPFIQIFGPDFKSMFKYYDNKFNLNILTDQEGRVIKIY